MLKKKLRTNKLKLAIQLIDKVFKNYSRIIINPFLKKLKLKPDDPIKIRNTTFN